MNLAQTAAIRYACVLAFIASGPAQAFAFGDDDAIYGFWTTTANAGTGYRTRNPDPMLVKRENGILLGVPDASGGGADDANLNFPRRGDNFSTVAKLFTDLDLRYRDFGLVARGKLWYDQRLVNRSVPHGTTSNGYVPNTRLDDDGFEQEARSSGATLSALFAYGKVNQDRWQIDFRVGQQAVLAGLGIGRYLRGISLNMPIDVPAIRRIGYLEPLPLSLPMNVFDDYVLDRKSLDDKSSGTPTVLNHDESRMALWRPLGSNTGYWDPEAPIPTGAAAASIKLDRDTSLAAFYQYQWRPTVGAPCGTYFSANDLNTDPSASGTCFAVQYGQVLGPTTLITEQEALAQRRFIRMVDEQLPSNGGQYGVTFWFPVNVPLPNLDGSSPTRDQKPLQIGLHFLNLNSTVPVLDGIRCAPGQLYDLQPVPVQGRWVYPESLRTYGVSARVDPAPPRAWMFGAELSYVPNAPAQINANDLLYGSLTAGAGPAGARVASVPVGSQVTGYDQVSKTQLIVNGGLGYRWKENAAFLFAETGFQWASLPQNGVRYGRAFMYGIAPAPGVAPAATICVQAPGNVGCENDGYSTHFSWGYRVKLVTNFNNVFQSISVRPALTYSQDVRGYSIDNQLAQGRQWWDLTLRLDTKTRYYLDVKYVGYSRGAKFDSLRDRDYISAYIGATF